MCKILDIEVQEISAHALDQFDRVAMVDVQPSFLEERFEEVDLVIDHHPVERPIHARIKDVRPSYGATSTILVEYLRARRHQDHAAPGHGAGLRHQGRHLGARAGRVQGRPRGLRLRLHAGEPQRAPAHRAAGAVRRRARPPRQRPGQAADPQGRLLLPPRARSPTVGPDPAVRRLRPAGRGRGMVGGLRRGGQRPPHLRAQRRLREERGRRDARGLRRSGLGRGPPHDGQGRGADPRVPEGRRRFAHGTRQPGT